MQPIPLMNATQSLTASFPVAVPLPSPSRVVAAPVSNVPPLPQHAQAALRHTRHGELLAFALIALAALLLVAFAFALV